MKERPILFKGDMVRAIMDGRKTQTRRVVKVQPKTDEFQLARILSSTGPKSDEGKLHWVRVNDNETRVLESDDRYFDCPYGQPGDLLWVRETHAIVPRTAYAMSDGVDQMIRPDDDHDAAVFREGWTRSPPGRWRPSIHMPRWASRITLEITDVRVERVQEIGREDALAEGIDRWDDTASVSPYRNYRKGKSGEMDLHCSCPERSFMTLWQSINGPDSWDANPWVWVVEFRRLP